MLHLKWLGVCKWVQCTLLSQGKYIFRQVPHKPVTSLGCCLGNSPSGGECQPALKETIRLNLDLDKIMLSCWSWSIMVGRLGLYVQLQSLWRSVIPNRLCGPSLSSFFSLSPLSFLLSFFLSSFPLSPLLLSLSLPSLSVSFLPLSPFLLSLSSFPLSPFLLSLSSFPLSLSFSSLSVFFFPLSLPSSLLPDTLLGWWHSTGGDAQSTQRPCAEWEGPLCGRQ